MSPSSGDHEGSLMAAVNEAIDRMHGSLHLADSDLHCECGQIGCKGRVTLTRGELAGLRQERRPLISPAHADQESAAETELHNLRWQVHQVKGTLASRVDIEQAKGLLIERHGMTPAAAFVALRQRARDQRQSLAEICAQIIARAASPNSERSEPSPSAPARRSQRVRAVDHEPTKKRTGTNASFFRAANEEIEVEAELLGVGAGSVPFVCECPDPNCVEIIELTLTEYEEVRTRPTRFFVLPGHHALAVEAKAAVIVEERDGVVIVDKIGLAGQIAAANHGKDSVAAVDEGHDG